MFHVFDSVQEAMIRSSLTGWEGLYAVCRCGYEIHDIDRHEDEIHAELCEEPLVWHWAPLKVADTTGQLTPITKDLVHFFHIEQGQTSLRCSYCAHARSDVIHARCTANWYTEYDAYTEEGPQMNIGWTQCYELATDTKNQLCSYHARDVD